MTAPSLPEPVRAALERERANRNGHTNGQVADRPTLRELDVAHMLATEPEPVPWLVEPLLARGHLTMLAGREGQGKSMLALAIAVAMGRSVPIAGMDCEDGTVMYVDAENGEREVHRRLRQLGAMAPERLHYFEADQFHLRDRLAELLGHIEDRRPDVVILDSFRSLWLGGDENDNAEVEAVLRPLINSLRDRQVAGLLLHHAGKIGGEYRGSTAIGAAVELGFTLGREPEDPRGRERRFLKCWKMRIAPEPEPRWLAIELTAGQLTVDETEPYEGAAPGRSKRDVLADEFVTIARDRGAPVQRSDLFSAVGRGSDDKTAKDALKAATDDGRLERLEHGLYAYKGSDYPNDPPNDPQGGSGHPYRGVTRPTLLDDDEGAP